MKWTLALGLVVEFLVLDRGRDVGAAVQQPQQIPQVTATRPELEQRDQPVTNDDLHILLKTAELLKDESGVEPQGRPRVRFAVEDATRGQDFEHRLRDVNNLSTTRLADIKRVLRVATDRVKSRLKNK